MNLCQAAQRTSIPLSCPLAALLQTRSCWLAATQEAEAQEAQATVEPPTLPPAAFWLPTRPRPPGPRPTETHNSTADCGRDPLKTTAHLSPCRCVTYGRSYSSHRPASSPAWAQAVRFVSSTSNGAPTPPPATSSEPPRQQQQQQQQREQRSGQHDHGQQGRQRGTQPSLSAAEVLAPLLEGRPFTVAQMPGRGRGLVASRPIAAGEVVHEERPMLAFPALEAPHQVCYHCLAAMPHGAGAVRHRGTGRRFCSDACLRAALQQYLAVEEAATAYGAGGRRGAVAAAADEGEGPLQRLYGECWGQGERFPLMAARLAFMHVSEAVRQRFDAARGAAAGNGSATGTQPGVSGSGAEPDAPAASSPSDGGGTISGGGDPLRHLHVLCYARVPPPYPEPWVRQHALLVAALRGLLTSGDAGLLPLVAAVRRPQPKPQEEQGQRQGQAAANGDVGAWELPAGALEEAVGSAVEELSVKWFVGVLGRLHLNVFQVHNPLPGCDPADLAAAASALVSGTAGGASSGSAAYLLASLFNHSCEPPLELSFPAMDGVAAFTAARDIDPGEELCVSYLDVGLPYNARRQHLEWSYGFACGCARCREEGAEEEEEAARERVRGGAGSRAETPGGCS